jgi:hypothetical protein
MGQGNEQSLFAERMVLQAAGQAQPGFKGVGVYRGVVFIISLSK